MCTSLEWSDGWVQRRAPSRECLTQRERERELKIRVNVEDVRGGCGTEGESMRVSVTPERSRPFAFSCVSFLTQRSYANGGPPVTTREKREATRSHSSGE